MVGAVNLVAVVEENLNPRSHPQLFLALFPLTPCLSTGHAV